MRRIALVMTLAAVLVAPAAADASTVTWREVAECRVAAYDCKYQRPAITTAIDYAAGPGERNEVVIRAAGDHVRVTDPGAVVRAEAPCTPVSASEAACPVASGGSIDLGDLDDTAVVAFGVEHREVSVRGGDGADLLFGGPFTDLLDGGPGLDRIVAGDGGDVIAAHAVDEPADVLDGGPGDYDLIDFSARTDPVTVRLEDLRGIETARGGRGDDTLVGTGGANTLGGGPGDDDLQGLGGDDLLTGHEGADRLSGGAGADRLAAFDGAPDVLACGGGLDRVRQDIETDSPYETIATRGVDLADALGRDCERLALDSDEADIGADVDPRVRDDGRTLRLRNPCAGRRDRRCRGFVRASVAGRRFTTRYGPRPRTIRLRVPATARRLRMRHHVRYGGGFAGKADWTLDR